MNLSLLCLLGWAPCHHKAALRLPDPSCVTSDRAGAQGSQAPAWPNSSVRTPLQGDALKTPLLAPDFPAQRQDNACYLQNLERDVEIIKGEGRASPMLPSLSLTWERGTQMPNVEDILPAAASASLAGTSGKLSGELCSCLLVCHVDLLMCPIWLPCPGRIPFNSPLNTRNSVYFAPFFPYST